LIEGRELNIRTLGMHMVTNPVMKVDFFHPGFQHPRGLFGEIFSSDDDLIKHALEHMFELT